MAGLTRGWKGFIICDRRMLPRILAATPYDKLICSGTLILAIDKEV